MTFRAVFAFGLAVALAGVGLVGLARAEELARAGDKPRCALTDLGGGTVQTVIDGRTVRLADGREVRLAGIEASDEAEAGLLDLAEDREVTLGRLGGTAGETDRYGRLVALIAVGSAPVDAENSLQTALLSQGLARVSAHIGNTACARALLEAEGKARSAGLGVWQDPAYLTRNADDFGAILGLKGHFAVVQGKVLSVRESGSTIYVNFGRRWSEDFTVTVPKRAERSFSAAGVALKKLTGQNVRVRGTIEERGGPWIEASAPEQIEVVE